MLTRRLALFRIASASAVAATAAAPVAIAAIQPSVAEDPVLLYLGRKVAKLDAICQHRKNAKAAARTAYETVALALPDELIVTRYSKGLGDSEYETDCEGEDVWPSDPHKGPRRYHSSDNIRRGLEEWADLDEDDLVEDERAARDYLQHRLPIAEQYEAGLESAAEQSDYPKASGDHYLACYALEKIVGRIAKLSSRTPEGITIKAQAYEAWLRSGHDRGQQFAAVIIGPGLAADVCRVLSEGGEA
jgi:hypothetical protein